MALYERVVLRNARDYPDIGRASTLVLIIAEYPA